jgi:hypothetical protein
MEDIECYIQRLREEQEVADFVNNGIYPTRLKSKFIQKKYYPPLTTNIQFVEYSRTTKNHTEKFDKNRLLNTINRLEKSLSDIINKNEDTVVNDENNDITNHNDTNIHEDKSCPICMEDVGDNNYLVPSCGHKLCMNCFVLNIVKNKHTGGYCSLCRSKIIPTVL